MGEAPNTTSDILRHKRMLRAEIARSRRRIDVAVRGVRREAGRLSSWQTYVRRFPGGAIGVAFGVGLLLSAGLRPTRVVRWLGAGIVRRATRRSASQLMAELASIWGEAAAKSTKRSEAAKGRRDGN